jgi:hypothetical protein
MFHRQQASLEVSTLLLKHEIEFQECDETSRLDETRRHDSAAAAAATESDSFKELLKRHSAVLAHRTAIIAALQQRTQAIATTVTLTAADSAETETVTHHNGDETQSSDVSRMKPLVSVSGPGPVVSGRVTVASLNKQINDIRDAIAERQKRIHDTNARNTSLLNQITQQQLRNSKETTKRSILQSEVDSLKQAVTATVAVGAGTGTGTGAGAGRPQHAGVRIDQERYETLEYWNGQLRSINQACDHYRQECQRLERRKAAQLHST